MHLDRSLTHTNIPFSDPTMPACHNDLLGTDDGFAAGHGLQFAPRVFRTPPRMLRFVLLLIALFAGARSLARGCIVPDDYRTITEALDPANNCQHILVRATKTYSLESGERFPLRVQAPVVIEGLAGGKPHLKGDGEHTVVLIETGGVTLRNFRITDGNGSEGINKMDGGGICIFVGPSETRDVNIVDCVIEDNTCPSDETYDGCGGGIYCGGTYCTCFQIHISDCNIYGNSVYGKGGGISCALLSNVDVSRTLIQDNDANDYGGGLFVDVFAAVDIKDSHLLSNDCPGDDSKPDWGGKGGGLACEDFGVFTVRDSIFELNTAKYFGGGIFTRGAVFTGEHVCGGGRQLPYVSRCQIKSNRADVSGGGVYVASTGILRFLSTTLYHNDAAKDGGGVFVAGGSIIGGEVHFGGLPPSVDLNRDGSVDGKDLSILARDWRMEDLPAVADINLDKIVNFSDLHELATYWPQRNSSPCSVACWKLDETEGSLAHDEWGGCRLEGNECGGPGGGGRGGGVYLGPHAIGTFGSTRFLGNSSLFDGGAMFLDNEANGILTNCLITYNNSARGYAGGIRVTGRSYLDLDHCSVVGNFAPHKRSGLYLDTEAIVDVNNSILWRNAGGSVQANGAIVNITASLNEDGPDLTNGVICCDPNYVGWGSLNDIYVDASSPCPGIGTPDAPYCDLQHALDGFDFQLADSSACKDAASDGRNMGADTGVGGLAGNTTVALHIRQGVYDIRGRSIICINDVYGVGTAETSIRNAVFGHVEDSNIMDLSITGEEIFGGFVVRADANFVNCNIHDNHADANGGGIYVAEGRCDMIQSTVSDNDCPDDSGGGLHSDANTVTTLADDSWVSDNVAAAGGGIHVLGQLDVTDSNFVRNSSGTGGAIYVNETADVNITYCRIYRNWGGSAAGGVMCLGQTRIENSWFERNDATDGGVIHIKLPGTVRCWDCNFVDNTARYGGALYMAKDTEPNFVDCNFVLNWARNYGGVGYCQGSGGQFNHCSFKANTARYWHGGCFYLSSTKTRFYNDCAFTEQNKARARAGGVGYSCDNDSSRFEDCHIDGSIAGTKGGAFCIEDSAQPNFTDVNIVDCNATEFGGGVAIFNTAEPNFVDVIIRDCNAVSGGGVYAGGDSKSTFRQCEFRNNLAYDLTQPRDGGGAYFTEKAVGIFTGCLFQDNYSQDDGGGMAVAELAFVRLHNTLFAGNNAMDDGAGVHFMFQAEGRLTNCTFASNNSINGHTGAGIFMETDNTVFVDSSIIWDNNPDGIRPEADPHVSYSCTQKLWPGPGNIAVDPCFADPNSSDYHLKSQAGRYVPSLGLDCYDDSAWVKDDVTSPCIDRGDPALPVGDEPAPNGGRINMGAYGGTCEASKSAWSRADFDHNGRVDAKDLKRLCQDWLAENMQTVADMDGDGIVDFHDFKLFARDWGNIFLPPNLVAWWKLDETEGRTAHDQVGTNHAILRPLEQGPTWTGGKVNGALQFDGLDDYLDCGDSDRLSPRQMTLSVWLKPDDVGSCHIVTRGRMYAQADYALMRTSTGKLELFVGQRHSGPVSVLSTKTTPPNEWSHVAVLLDGSTASIYICDPLKLDAAANYGERVPPQGYRLIIGSHQGEASYYLGAVDDIRIYEQALEF